MSHWCGVAVGQPERALTRVNVSAGASPQCCGHVCGEFVHCRARFSRALQRSDIADSPIKFTALTSSSPMEELPLSYWTGTTSNVWAFIFRVLTTSASSAGSWA